MAEHQAAELSRVAASLKAEREEIQRTQLAILRERKLKARRWSHDDRDQIQQRTGDACMPAAPMSVHACPTKHRPRVPPSTAPCPSPQPAFDGLGLN